MARLGEIFTISSGGTPNKKEISFYEQGTIPWVKTGDLKEKYVPAGIECITKAGLNNSSAKLFPPNTVLIAMYGATIGACSILPYEASTNQACAAFLPCDNVLPEYLFYFLSSKKDQFVKDGVGGAQPNISAGYLKNVEFDTKPIDKQKEVICSLNLADNLISLRKQQLAKLDELIKARFVELFGDPISNPHGFDKVALSELADIKIGPFGSLLHKEDYIEGGHALLNPSHIIDGKVAPDNKLTVSNQKYEELSAYHLKIGDVVMGRRGEMGRCAVVPCDGYLCGTGSLMIRAKGQVTADYIQKIISFPSF